MSFPSRGASRGVGGSARGGGLGNNAVRATTVTFANLLVRPGSPSSSEDEQPMNVGGARSAAMPPTNIQAGASRVEQQKQDAPLSQNNALHQSVQSSSQLRSTSTTPTSSLRGGRGASIAVSRTAVPSPAPLTAITNVNSAHEASTLFKSDAETNGGPPATVQPEQVDAPTDQSATKENNNYKEATEAHLQNSDPAPRSGFGVTGLGIVRGGTSFRGAPLHRGGRGRAFATCVSRPANTASEQPTLQFAAQTTTTTDTETGPDRTASPASASPVPVSDGKQTALDHSSSTANVFVNGGSVRPGDGTAPFRSRGHSLLTPRGGTGRGAATALRPTFSTQSTIGENYKEPESAAPSTFEDVAPQPPVAATPSTIRYDSQELRALNQGDTANVSVNGGNVGPGGDTAPYRSRGHSLLTPRGGTGRGAATALRPAFNTQSTIGENYKEPASAILNTLEAVASQPPVPSATSRGTFSSGRAGFSRGSGIAARSFANAQSTTFDNNQALQPSDQATPGSFSNVQPTTGTNVHEPQSAELTPSAVSSGYSEPDNTNVRQEPTGQSDQSASCTTASTDTSSRGGGHGAHGFRVAFGAGRSATGRGGSSISASTFAAVQEQRTERKEEVVGTQQNITTSFSASTEATATCSVGFANAGFGSTATAAPAASATTTSSFGATANVSNTFARGLSSAPRGSRGGRGGIFGATGGFTANTQSTQNVGVLENTGFGATISATPKSSTDVVTTVDATVTDTGAPGATNAFSRGGISPLSSRGGCGGGFGRGGSFTANTQSTQNVGVLGSTGFGATISETPRTSTDVVTTVDASVTDTAAPGATSAFARGGISARGSRGGRGGGFGRGGSFTANTQSTQNVGVFGSTGFGATISETPKSSTDVVTTVDASVTDTAAPGATGAFPRGGISGRGNRGGRGGGFGTGGGSTANSQTVGCFGNTEFGATKPETPKSSTDVVMTLDATATDAGASGATNALPRGGLSARGSRGGRGGGFGQGGGSTANSQTVGCFGNTEFGATKPETPKSSTDVVMTLDATATDAGASGATNALPRGGLSARGSRGGRGGGFGQGGGSTANSQTVGCFGNTEFGATKPETPKSSTDVVMTLDATATDAGAPGATNALPRGGISARGSRGGGFGQGGGFTANDQNPKTGSNVGFIDTTSNAATPAASFTTTSEAVMPKVTGSFARGANSVRGNRGGHFGSSSSAQVADLSAQFAGSAANSRFGNVGFGESASGARSGEGAASGSASSEFDRHDPTDGHNTGFATTEKSIPPPANLRLPAGRSLASAPARSQYPTLNFQGFLKQPQDVVTAKRSELFGNLHGPLGCIYEPGTKQWIVTDTDANNVRLFDPRDNKGGLRVWQDNGVIRHPSALALLEAGQSFVVLDNNGIWEHDLRNQQLAQRVAFSPGGGRMGEYRGLVVTADNELVTTRRTRDGTKILVFSNEASAEVVAEINYEVPRTPGSRGPNPCFMDCMQDRICITDLGTGGLTVYQYEKQAGAHRTMTPVAQLMCKAEGGGRQDGKFQFISGVRLDENAEMWVCDAQGFSIQWLDQQGQFRSRLHFDDGFCYCSGFALNVADSQLLACDRKRNVAKLYDINSSTSGPVQNKTIK